MTWGGAGVWCGGWQGRPCQIGLGERIFLARDEPQPPSLMRSAVAH